MCDESDYAMTFIEILKLCHHSPGKVGQYTTCPVDLTARLFSFLLLTFFVTQSYWGRLVKHWHCSAAYSFAERADMYSSCIKFCTKRRLHWVSLFWFAHLYFVNELATSLVYYCMVVRQIVREYAWGMVVMYPKSCRFLFCGKVVWLGSSAGSCANSSTIGLFLLSYCSVIYVNFYLDHLLNWHFLHYLLRTLVNA